MIWIIAAAVWLLLAVTILVSWARLHSLRPARCQCGHPQWPEWVHGERQCFPVREML